MKIIILLLVVLCMMNVNSRKLLRRFKKEKKLTQEEELRIKYKNYVEQKIKEIRDILEEVPENEDNISSFTKTCES
jgi:hypothetical protein